MTSTCVPRDSFSTHKTHKQRQIIFSSSFSQQQKEKRIRVSKRSLGYSAMADPCVSCTTFNILAPIYKRLDKEDQSCRESHYRAYWLSRNQSIIDRLLVDRSSIICLKEVWLGNEELVDMYEKRLGDAGYINLKLARRNNRGDGLLNYRRIIKFSARGNNNTNNNKVK